jgi:hypothetical protein
MGKLSEATWRHKDADPIRNAFLCKHAVKDGAKSAHALQRWLKLAAER